jgi:hypothetical protein
VRGWGVPIPTTVPEIIDPVFAKTSQNARFLLSENEPFGFVFVKTGSINSGTGEKAYHSAYTVMQEQIIGVKRLMG